MFSAINSGPINIRPKIKAGDIVKLSKKGKKYCRTFDKNSTLIVSNVQGDGIDHSSVITCRVRVCDGSEVHKFYRSELWFTGKSVFSIF